MLMRAPHDGSFLVRKKECTEKNQEAFALSFKYVLVNYMYFSDIKKYTDYLEVTQNIYNTRKSVLSY